MKAAARRALLPACGAVLVVAVALAPGSAGASTAPPPERQQRELRRVQQQLDAQRQRLQAARRREHRLADEIQRLDREREASERRLARLAADLGRVRQQAQGAAAALARAEQVLAQRRDVMAERLVDAHRHGRAGYLDVVLGATTFSEFVARAQLVGAVVREDARLVKVTAADRDRAAQLREELEARQAQVRALVRETEERRRLLEGQQAAKREMLQRIVRERSSAEQAVRELEEDSTRLEALIRQVQQAGAPLGIRRVGAFYWPLRGPLTSRFGVRRHPIFARRFFHAGVDIAAPRGTPVRAAYEGTVIFAGWYGGYGKLVIVDHGQGISTLYGHLSAFRVSAGQRITRNQVLGLVGSTGYSTGPHLHYEIRHNGRPIDPAP